MEQVDVEGGAPDQGVFIRVICGRTNFATFDSPAPRHYVRPTIQMSTATTAEPVISLTPSAAEQVKTMLANEQDSAGKRLRVYVEKGGCSGMQYGMVFDEARDGDAVAEFHGVGVLTDAISADLLRGCVIDFKDELTGGGFKISNPNAKQSCGCGKSFEA